MDKITSPGFYKTKSTTYCYEYRETSGPQTMVYLGFPIWYENTCGSRIVFNLDLDVQNESRDKTGEV